MNNEWEKEFESTNDKAKAFMSDLKLLLKKHKDVSVSTFRVNANA